MTDAELAELYAKQKITEVIHRYCRALDRMDAELAYTCWHEGGTDDHAPLFSGLAKDFIAWVWPLHAGMISTRHIVNNTLIDLRGDEAGAESYWTVTLRMERADGVYDVIGGGRYVDTFERKGGVWAIRHRQSLHDWDRVEKVTTTLADPMDPPLILPNNPDVPPKPSARDKTDYSYTVLGPV